MKTIHLFKKETIIILFILSILNAHNFNIRLKDSSIPQTAHTMFKSIDNYGDGFYTFLKMSFDNFEYINEMGMSKSSYDMRKGRGKKVKGVYGFSNQGYITFSNEKNSLKNKLKFGRFYINHGFGQTSKIFISNHSRPFDGIGWNASYKKIEGKMYGVQLDPIENNNRYLSIHTIDFKFWDNITLSFGESSLYAGENRGIELQYFNPTLFWIPVRENQPKRNQANGILYSGIKFAKEKYSIWLEFILDDFQIDRSIQEPTTYGVLFGMGINKPFRMVDDFLIEYSRVSNRTYQTLGEFGQENYVHRGFPIGHYLGNDFDHSMIVIGFEKVRFSSYNILPKFSASLIRDGNEGIDTPWDQPWVLDENLIEDIYREDFPSPPVSIIFENETIVSVTWDDRSFFDLGIFYQNIDKEGHKSTDLRFLLRYNLVFNWNFLY